MTREERQIRGRLYYLLFSEVMRHAGNINYAVIKGEPLSILQYGKPGCREYRDIDILTDRRNVARFTASLEKAGFQPVDAARDKRIFFSLYSHQTIPYGRKIGNLSVVVDINYDIFWGEYQGGRPDMEEFLSDSMQEKIYGVNVRVLSPLKALVQLALHTYREMNSLFLLYLNSGYTERPLQDLRILLESQKEVLTAQQVRKYCESQKILPYVYYAVYAAALFYGEHWMTQYAENLKTEEGERLLPYFGLNEKERKCWKEDFFKRFRMRDFRKKIREECTNVLYDLSLSDDSSYYTDICDIAKYFEKNGSILFGMFGTAPSYIASYLRKRFSELGSDYEVEFYTDSDSERYDILFQNRNIGIITFWWGKKVFSIDDWVIHTVMFKRQNSGANRITAYNMFSKEETSNYNSIANMIDDPRSSTGRSLVPISLICIKES